MKIAVFGAAGWLGRAILSAATGRADIRAFDRGPEAWDEWRDVDGDWEGEIVHGDIVDFDVVAAAISSMEAVIHTAVLYPRVDVEHDPRPFLVNLKGLWNVLENARLAGISRVVFVGSCMTIHPWGRFFDADERSIEGDLYGICKRLQEEMCRQFHDAWGMSTIVLRPDYIVDSRRGIGRFREPLGPGSWRQGLVCRHDLAEACLLAATKPDLGHEVLHIVGTVGAEQYCNVARGKEVLGLEYKGDLERFR